MESIITPEINQRNKFATRLEIISFSVIFRTPYMYEIHVWDICMGISVWDICKGNTYGIYVWYKCMGYMYEIHVWYIFMGYVRKICMVHM